MFHVTHLWNSFACIRKPLELLLVILTCRCKFNAYFWKDVAKDFKHQISMNAFMVQSLSRWIEVFPVCEKMPRDGFRVSVEQSVPHYIRKDIT